jgi:DASS family divalent anion:Na+ symporter
MVAKHDAERSSEVTTDAVDYRSLLICLGLGCIMWFAPHPEGLPTQGWHLLTIFAITILALILKPLPMGAVTILAMVISILTKTLTPTEAFAGFKEQIVWLVVFALFIAKGFSVTGLGKRIAYLFTYLLGKSSLGLSYGLLATDLIMAPAIPSVTGRMAGIVYPILKGIANSYQSFPFSASSRKIGGFLTVTAFQGTVVTSSMFMTAMAANPLLTKLTNEQNLSMSWPKWALTGIVPGLISLLLIPLVVYFVYPPEIKQTPNAPKNAYDQLKVLGKITRHEWIMSATVILLLVLWIFGGNFGVNAVLAAMIGVSILLLTGVLKWNDLMKIDTAWDTFVWFCILIMLASNLKHLGVIQWFSESVGDRFTGLNWKIAFPLLALVYFYSHYFFASSTAHVTSMYIPFLLLGIALGTPPMLAALILIFFSSLYGGLTHYSLAPAPLLYAAGYVDIKDWWKLGFIVSILNIAIWSTIGVAWWKLLGFW